MNKKRKIDNINNKQIKFNNLFRKILTKYWIRESTEIDYETQLENQKYGDVIILTEPDACGIKKMLGLTFADSCCLILPGEIKSEELLKEELDQVEKKGDKETKHYSDLLAIKEYYDTYHK